MSAGSKSEWNEDGSTEETPVESSSKRLVYVLTNGLDRGRLSASPAVVFSLILLGGQGLLAWTAWAETWVCPRPGQTDLYTDHGESGCSQLREAKISSPLQIAPAPVVSPRRSVPRPAVGTTSTNALMEDIIRPLPFPDVSVPLPVVGVGQRRAGALTGPWIGLVAQLTIGYRADGMGPEILPDSNMMPVSVHALETAVAVAAKAVGYDPKYLTVRMLIPTPMDGPSAGGICAVGIAAALLGDSMRQDICMSGTIEDTFEIKPVGRLVDKMNACQYLKKKTMIVPDESDNSHLSFAGSEKTIRLIEVHTLPEAYVAATGQALRQGAFH